MSWGVKYRCEYTDILGLDWKWEYELDSYAGAITEMQASGEAGTIEWLSPNDDIYEFPIKGSKADLVIESESDFKWLDLYTAEDMRIRCSVYAGGSLFWRGFNMTDNYSEPYNRPSYSVTMSASDGLGYLKNIKYDNAGVYYTGRKLQSQVLFDILGKVNIPQFTECINMYEEGMDDGVGDSPLDQCQIDVSIFQDRTCYDVLEAILKPYNAIIKQKDGEFYILRPVELKEATVYGRIFTGSTTKTATSYSTDQFISRPTSKTDIIDREGGTLMVKGPAKSVTAHQDYGNKESWIENFDFKGNTFTGTLIGGYTLRNWTLSSSHDILPATSIGEQDGVGLVEGGYIIQSFAPNATTTTDQLIIELDYLISNYAGSDTFYINVTIKSDSSSNWIYPVDGIYANWTGSLDQLIIVEVVNTGVSSWKNYKRIIQGLPADGSYTVTITYTLGNATSAVFFKSIKFYGVADGLTKNKTGVRSIWQRIQGGYGGEYQIRNKYYNIKYIEPKDVVIENNYIKTNAIEGSEKSFDYALGDVIISGVDNVIEQCAGSLALATITSYTDSVDKVDTVTIAVDGGGTAQIQCGGITRTITWNTDTDTTIVDFIATQGAYYTGLTLNKTSSDTFTFTGASNFADATDATPDSGWITAVNTTSYFIGYPVFTLTPTTDWNTRGGSESKPVLEITGDELAYQMSRPRHAIRMPMIESGNSSLKINIIGNIQDSYNQISGNNRVFIINSCIFVTRDREWNMDLVEIV